jgi:hypothetical protein
MTSRRPLEEIVITLEAGLVLDVSENGRFNLLGFQAGPAPPVVWRRKKDG